MLRKYLGDRTAEQYIADRMDDAVDCLKFGDRPAAESIWRDLNENFYADERVSGREIFSRRHGI